MGNERSTFVIDADAEGKISQIFRKVKPAEHDAQVLAASAAQRAICGGRCRRRGTRTTAARQRFEQHLGAHEWFSPIVGTEPCGPIERGESHGRPWLDSFWSYSAERKDCADSPPTRPSLGCRGGSAHLRRPAGARRRDDVRRDDTRRHEARVH
jgi:hypothetical protein